MNIVLDGPSGVGKTYLGKKLAEKLDLDFIDFVLDKADYDPNDPDIEVITFNQIINNHYFNGHILENSILQSFLVKHYLYEKKYISHETFFKIVDSFISHRNKVTPFILINVYDTTEEIQMKRKVRNREWEYTPDITEEDLLLLDEITLANYHQCRNGYHKGIIAKSSSIIAIINHDRTKYNNINDEIQALTKNIQLALRQI